ncbi:S4 domain-containing protein YaaA [Streptococcus massiliensis]|uniref:S4 domain-containing protein YaaA n=1 Tax=Streptococcus massiliensis TaxID=313439 RepID=A0A380KYF3_9STRE|nr:S4 domain-containing protein YaaA [Streptococcus massiliensis]SUN76309.1 S4 domain-containing protein YaaA [Streptococcus massiliensis]
MDYKLFNDYITLQSLLKELGIIQSGGAIKNFLVEKKVFVNDQLENRRGKKLRLGEHISIPELGVDIILTAPNNEEVSIYKEEQKEKKHVAKLVKQLNKSVKQTHKKNTSQKTPVRFPGI